MTATTTGRTLADRATAALMDTYQRQPVALRSGHGVWVTADDGREYLDLVAGIAVNILGHDHPALREAIAAQASTLMHTSNLYYTEPQLELAERLIASAFPSRVFFCNSGAEANEGAIKLARKWGKLNRNGAHVIVCMEGAFHGRTLGALSVLRLRQEAGARAGTRQAAPRPAGQRPDLRSASTEPPAMRRPEPR